MVSLSHKAHLILIILSIIYNNNAQICSASSPPNDHYLLNCGAATTAVSFDNRTWYSDNNASFASPADLTAATSTTTTKSPTFGSNQVPCSAARVFHSNFTYSFPVSPGPKFIRLYLCPATSSTATFLSLLADGGAGPFTLLHNYSAFLQTSSSSHDDMIRLEFLLIVTDNTSELKLIFFPTTATDSPSVNGIEVVSIPDHLYNNFYDNNPTRSPGDRVKNVDNRNTPYSTGLNPVAFETVIRLNVGGYSVDPEKDSGGMYRAWLNDEKFADSGFMGAIPNSKPIRINYSLVLEYTAPEAVYWTAREMGPYNATLKMMNNLTWKIPVDPGFEYLVRLHFCEIDPTITASNERVFTVDVNNRTAEKEVDVIALSHNIRATPVCMDYAFSATDVTLRISLHPDIEQKPEFHDAILNGLEVFKLSQPNRSLAALNPSPSVYSTSPDQLRIRQNSSHNKLLLPLIIGGIVAIISAAAVFAFWRRNKAGKNSRTRSNGSNNNVSGSGSRVSLPSHLCKRFALSQIKLASCNFDENMVVGHGGFGKVYKGFIPVDDGKPTTTPTNNNNNVAIKRLNPSSKQGAHEFRTEIEMLSVLRHTHLVSLIGYCDEGEEMVLVYEYMPRGTLRDHLYTRNTDKNPNPSLPWKQRLTACIGAARGLHYLHAGTNNSIIHRDVKSTNILLDEKFTAKVSDFGISKVGPVGEAGHVSTMVKGSLGYLDPEYHRFLQLTTKSDVYSFGVVLFEVLCGRQVINATLPRKQVNLAMWGRSNYLGGTLAEIVDPDIAGQVAPECLKKFGEVAEMCVLEQGRERPSMGDVVCGLEFCLQLQLAAEKNEDLVSGGSGLTMGSNLVYADSNRTIDMVDSTPPLPESLSESSYRNGTSTSNGDDNTSFGSVFSEIKHTQSR